MILSHIISKIKMTTQQITIAPASSSPLTVPRFGYGAMRLTGEGIWGEPANRTEALEILKHCIDSGIRFIDTADFYGDDVTNRLIAEALHPYPHDLVICTKVGATRRPDKSWVPYDRPEQLRHSIERNLRTLRQEQVTLVHLRNMVGSGVPFAERIQAMYEMQREGLILHVGVSNVSADELQQAMNMGAIATVENLYGHGQRTTFVQHGQENRGGEEVLAICEANGIPLIPYFSLVTAGAGDERIATIARRYGVTEAQVHLAWLLHRSPCIVPIPGTSSMSHLRENIKASEIQLSAEDMAYLT